MSKNCIEMAVSTELTSEIVNEGWIKKKNGGEGNGIGAG